MTTRLLLAAVLCFSALPQQPAPADLAAKISGTWKLNKELSPTLATPGPGRGGRRGGGALFAAAATPVPQRGGSRGNAEAPPPDALMVTQEEAAARVALSAIQQVPQELTIAATATEMTLTEPRGPSTFKIDSKDAKVEVPGGSIKVKSRWDRATLKQEFSSAMRKLTRSWSVDANGRLVLDQRFEGVGLKRFDVQAVFDKQ